MKTLTTKQKNTMTNQVKGCETKSSKIRTLNSKGHSRADIARFLDIRYQHVRNVLVQPLKKKA